VISLPIVAVGGVVLREDGRVLLVQRASAPGRGTWTIPGGNVHPGERLHVAVVRELAEETALRVQVLRLLDVVEILQESFHYVVLDYLCRPLCDPDDARAGSDAAALRWAYLGELSVLGVADAARCVIEQARAPQLPPS
jgi:8-oxo-dGTP diphosphatase